MKDELKKYAFSETNQKTLIFLPGYSGGLQAPIIAALTKHFEAENDIDVLGIELPYESDHVDQFNVSQNVIVTVISSFSQEFPNKNIYIIAKSLGGSLALFDAHKLPVKGIVILGCSFVLGWPQRISLLSSSNPVIPDYKKEWSPVLQEAPIPVKIITGEKDDLTDNDFLLEAAKENPNIDVVKLSNTNHNLQEVENGTIQDQECIKIIENLIA